MYNFDEKMILQKQLSYNSNTEKKLWSMYENILHPI